MKPFKEFYFNLLKETPYNIRDDEEYFSEPVISGEIYNDIMSSPEEYELAFSLKGEYPINLMQKKERGDVMCYFLPTNGNNMIYGYVYYTLTPDGGVITTSVYNAKKYVGLAFRVYNEFLLSKYKYVMSDGTHTEKGRNFWRNLIVFNLKTHPICVWDVRLNKSVLDVKNPNDVDAFYGDYPDFERYRIRIENI